MTTVPPLMGVAEIGYALGVSRGRAHNIAKDHPDFPEPDQVLAMGPVWEERRVREWALRHGRTWRKAGPPPGERLDAPGATWYP